METDNRALEKIRKKTRQRFTFAIITWVLYASFLLSYIGLKDTLSGFVGNSSLSGGLLLFIGLLCTFVVLEYIFIRRKDSEEV